MKLNKKVTKAICRKAPIKANTKKIKKTNNLKKGKKTQKPKENGKPSESSHIMPAHVILKKRQGEALSEPEIRHFIDGLAKGTVPEYQMSALAMAICF